MLVLFTVLGFLILLELAAMHGGGEECRIWCLRCVVVFKGAFLRSDS
jgi:hypothetical protein